jgi:RimK family alpha-L-glutamate ligase
MKVLWLGWEDLYTTQRMRDAAQRLGLDLHACEILDIAFAVENGQAMAFAKGVDLLSLYDVLFVRTFHPYISETLTLARLFSEAGKIVIDQSLTDEGYAVSKMHDHLVLTRNGIPTPCTWQVCNPQQIKTLAEQLTYPCVLKSVHGARGQHVYLIHDAEQLNRRLRHYPWGELMLQEYLPGSEDYRIFVIGYQALPIMVSRKPPRGDFRTNFSVGGKFVKRELSEFPNFKEVAEQAARALRREFTAVDIRLKNGQPVVLEVNRQPDFRGFEYATRFDVASEVVRYIQMRGNGNCRR